MRLLRKARRQRIALISRSNSLLANDLGSHFEAYLPERVVPKAQPLRTELFTTMHHGIGLRMVV